MRYDPPPPTPRYMREPVPAGIHLSIETETKPVHAFVWVMLLVAGITFFVFPLALFVVGTYLTFRDKTVYYIEDMRLGTYVGGPYDSREAAEDQVYIWKRMEAETGVAHPPLSEEEALSLFT